MPSAPGDGHPSSLSEIENPNPQPGTNNFYIQDGYGGGSGSPGAATQLRRRLYATAPIRRSRALARSSAISARCASRRSDCEAGHYYLLNNYNPGYFGDGTNAYTDTNAANYLFTVPPSTCATSATY